MSVGGLRIAHCSDIHLSGGAADTCRAGFVRALMAIRRRAPDLMLLAGDLFDTNTVPDETVLWAMDTLAALPFPVAMIPGNHDCMVPGGIYRRFDFGAIANVVFLGEEAGSVAEIPALHAVVWGRGMVDHAPRFRPLAGIPARSSGARWHLGLGHGIFVARGEQTHRSSPIRMEEIEASGFDYLALGHHHAAMDLATPAVCAAYSGSPTDALGCGPSYAMVELGGPGAAVLRIEVVD
jgi:DNA repair exonuclease SbcCD nuclease subunit